jgi:hypothetical protein
MHCTREKKGVAEGEFLESERERKTEAFRSESEKDRSRCPCRIKVAEQLALLLYTLLSLSTYLTRGTIAHSGNTFSPIAGVSKHCFYGELVMKGRCRRGSKHHAAPACRRASLPLYLSCSRAWMRSQLFSTWLSRGSTRIRSVLCKRPGLHFDPSCFMYGL